MKFPEEPTCHYQNGEPHVPVAGPDRWVEPRIDEKYGITETFRRCNYCGSMHPEDFVKAMEAGATTEVADMKYGFPHKLYLDGIRNPTAGQECQVGTQWKDGVETPLRGKAPQFLAAKFYTDHVWDQGYDDEAKAALDRALAKAGLRFEIDAQGRRCWTRWRAE